jgi:hypothetical protein
VISLGNSLNLCHLPAVMGRGLCQSGRGFARGGEQCLNESPGLAGIKANLTALMDDLKGRLTNVRNDKLSHGASFNRGCGLEKLLVRRCYTRHKSPAFLLFCYRLHAPNVCLCDTHCKN